MLLVKKISSAATIFIYILCGFVIQLLTLFLPKSFRYRYISYWTNCACWILKRILGIEVILEGNIASLKKGGYFIVSNHLSYLDGIILGSLFPVIFVSKLQVRSWPIFGWMTRAGGTIFIDREKKLKARASLTQIANVLNTGGNVLLFPEGTSTNGRTVLAFQSIFFQASLEARSPVLPVTIRYQRLDSRRVSRDNCDMVCWYGQIPFFKHLRGVLELKTIEAKVAFHSEIQPDTLPNSASSRKQLSRKAEHRVRSCFLHFANQPQRNYDF